MSRLHVTSRALRCLLAAISLVLVACNTAYYKTMERFGYEKRDILVSRIEEARDAQNDAKEQFQSALEKFKEVVAVPESELEKKYDEVNAEFQRSEARAKAVHDRIDAVENVGNALFSEWNGELGQYKSAAMRRESERKLRETRQRYDEVVAAMHRAENRITPVLDALRDQTLFLKHNLNAHAVASMRTELTSIESDTASLIKAMESSIAQSDAFIRSMGIDHGG
jgi:uncharacterized protein YukE